MKRILPGSNYRGYAAQRGVEFRRTATINCVKIPKLPDLSFERAAHGVIAGIDEAGCAPLAGPVVAAALVLPQWVRKPRALHGLNDSKQVAGPERERLHLAITQIARFGVGIATVEEIDTLNIYQANMLACAARSPTWGLLSTPRSSTATVSRGLLAT